jgi:hypothetical protein
MDSKKYIGMDVHKAAISAAVMDSGGKVVIDCVIESRRSRRGGRKTQTSRT